MPPKQVMETTLTAAPIAAQVLSPSEYFQSVLSVHAQ
jgi:hypothetical protein